jgi:uncharacterized protein (UPF0333 family)
MAKLASSTLYILIGAGVIIAIAVVYFIQSKSGSGDSAPDGASPTGIGAAISDAITGAAQYSTQAGSDLGNETNGIIFGGGA